MPPSRTVPLVLIVALGPWLVADALFVRSGQSQAHWAAGFLTGAFVWAVFVIAAASAWFCFGHLIQRGPVVAVTGSLAAFFGSAALFGFICYALLFSVHVWVFGGTI